MFSTKKQPPLSEFGEMALKCASQGFVVLPLQPNGKEPLCDRELGLTHGVKDATNDPKLIRKIWQKYPDANIGIATGASGLLVIDIDGDLGKESFYELVEELDDLPDTNVLS